MRTKVSRLAPSSMVLALAVLSSGCLEEVKKIGADYQEASTYSCCLDTKQYVCNNNPSACSGPLGAVRASEGDYSQCAGGSRPSCDKQLVHLNIKQLFGPQDVEAKLRWTATASLELAEARRVTDSSERPPAGQTTTSCLQLCKDGVTDANCLAVKLAVGQRNSLQQFYSEVSRPQAVWSIAPERLRQIFAVASDPCGRNSLGVKDGVLTNAGEACSLEAEVIEMSLEATVFIPAVLKASWMRGNSSVTATFAGDDDRPLLTFRRPSGSVHPLTREFGGAVHLVEANSRSMYVQSESGCVGVLF